MSRSTVAVVGGGPYGLACTAHLRGAGLETQLLGPRTRFWERHMPQGTFLRSRWQASSISDPRGSLTIQRTADARDRSWPAPPLSGGVAKRWRPR